MDERYGTGCPGRDNPGSIPLRTIGTYPDGSNAWPRALDGTSPRGRTGRVRAEMIIPSGIMPAGDSDQDHLGTKVIMMTANAPPGSVVSNRDLAGLVIMARGTGRFHDHGQIARRARVPLSTRG